MSNKFYITTPLYYVNASPHIGHSYTNIAADTIARFKRKAGYNVYFLTGTDEHGQKIEKAAGELKLTPKEFADKMVLQFRILWKALNISYDDFIRTTEERHIIVVRKVLSLLYKNGDIYEDKYQGLYCTPCETFWLESQVTDNLCPDCKRPLERIEETNYFFRLSKYQDWLIDYIETNPLFIVPKIRSNAFLSFLKLNKLNDLCISRPKERLSWGIPLPFSPGHVTYVWFDALINYISAVGTFDEAGSYNSSWWPADLQLIGKDILRQHAVYWPIMLRSLGIDLPKTIFAHGWWMVGEDKMSKSRGNVVSPVLMADKFGIDVYRYFLLRDVPFGLDGSFSEMAIIKRFNSDLANDLGNLVYRTLTMIEKYFHGKVPEVDVNEITDNKDVNNILEKIRFLNESLPLILAPPQDFNFSLALEKIWELINISNKYVEDTKPWNLAKNGEINGLKAFIYLLVKVIREVADKASPFIPYTADSIISQIGEDEIKKGNPLFPRIVN